MAIINETIKPQKQDETLLIDVTTIIVLPITGLTMILLTQDQADRVRNKYGKYSALNPIEVVEGYALPLEVLNDNEFESIKVYLSTLPQVEVTYLPSPILPFNEN